jgi:hypothetical protein
MVKHIISKQQNTNDRGEKRATEKEQQIVEIRTIKIFF